MLNANTTVKRVCLVHVCIEKQRKTTEIQHSQMQNGSLQLINQIMKVTQEQTHSTCLMWFSIAMLSNMNNKWLLTQCSKSNLSSLMP